jgi:tetratricopeptide (TPR) repeat protein
LIANILVIDGSLYGQDFKEGAIQKSELSELEYYFAFTEATKYFMLGNYMQAVSLYSECLKIRPKSSATHYQLSRVFMGAGNSILSLEHAKKACLYDPNNKWYLQGLTDIYQIDQKYDSAILILHKLSNIEPKNISYMLNIASLYEKVGELDNALKYLNLIDTAIGLSKEVSVSRYRIYERKKMYHEALSELNVAYSLSNGDYILTGMMAEYYRNRNMTDSAAKYYTLIFPMHKNDPMVAFSYAEFLLEQSKYDSAKHILLNIMENKVIDNTIKSGYFLKVIQNDRVFNLTKSVLDTVVTAYYKQYSKDIHTMSVYSDIEVRLRNYQKASNALKRIIDIDNTNYLAYEQLLYVLNMLNKKDSLLYYSNEAIERFKDRPLVFLFNGSAKIEMKDYMHALEALERGLALAVDKGLKIQFYSLIAECYRYLKEYQKSNLSFDQALLLDKDNILIKNNYAYYLSLRDENLPLAKLMSKTTIKKEPKNSTYLDTYAWVLFKMKKNKMAMKYIIKALNSGDSISEEILIHGGEIFFVNKEYQEALNCYNQVLPLLDDPERINIELRITEIKKMMLN